MYILQKMGWADQKRGIQTNLTIDQVLVRSGDGHVFPGDVEVKDIYIVSSEIFCPETCNLVSLEEVPTYFASRHPFCLPEPSGNSRQVAVFAAISREPRSVGRATVMVSEPVLKNEAPRSSIGSCMRCPCCH